MTKRRPAKKTPPKKTKSKATARRHVTRKELAALLGCHMMTVTKWEQEGLPIASRGGKGRATYYDESQVRTWLQRRQDAAARSTNGSVDLVKERARKERAQAVLAEQAYSIRTRDLLPRDEVEKGWSAVIGAVRTKLLSLPATLSDQLARAAVVDGEPGVERILQAAVTDALRELAQMKGDGVAA
jgi:phage terminase Nu1 subunit (DNA packaging protein)